MTSQEKIATRTMFTGEKICLWSNGSITTTMGFYVEGSPRPRTPKGVGKAIAAGWLVMGDCEIYDREELPMLIKAALWTADRDRLPGTMRARFRHLEEQVDWPVPIWATEETDSSGCVVSRTWVPHRLSPWAGYAVWNDPRQRGGRYLLARLIPGTTTMEPYGLGFDSLAELLRFMASPENRPVVIYQNSPNDKEGVSHGASAEKTAAPGREAGEPSPGPQPPTRAGGQT